MEIAFGNQSGAAPAPVLPTPAPAATTPPTPTPAATQAVTPYQRPGSLAPTGLVLGDFVPEFKDIILPRLNLAQNIGEVGKQFAPGSLVWDSQNNGLCLWHPQVVANGVIVKQSPPPVIVCVLGFRPTRYVEKVQGGTGMIVNSEDEVRSNGGTLDYREWDLKKASGMRLFQYMADAVIAIRRPVSVPDDDMVFNFPVENDKYTIGLFAMKGAAYTAACKGAWFVHRSTGCLRKEGYPSWHYNLTSRLKTFGEGKEAWVPNPIPAFKSTPAFIEFAKEILQFRPAEATSAN